MTLLVLSSSVTTTVLYMHFTDPDLYAVNEHQLGNILQNYLGTILCLQQQFYGINPNFSTVLGFVCEHASL